MDREILKARLRDWDCYKCKHLFGARFPSCRKFDQLPDKHFCLGFKRMRNTGEIPLKISSRVVEKNGILEHEYYFTI